MRDNTIPSRRLGVGVIGVGGMGEHHARNLAHAVPAARLVALMDVDPARLRRTAAACGVSRTFSDGRALIDDPEVEAVLIAAPDRFHAPLSQACLDAGKAVLCEKPLALTAPEARCLVETEAALGRRLIQVGLMREYDPAHLQVKQAVDSGALGRALAFHALHVNVGSGVPRTIADVITNSAVHDLHSARWLMNDEVVRVSTAYAPYGPEQPDTARLVLIQLHFRNGGIGHIECNVEAGYGYEVEVKITGETGAVQSAPPPHPLLRQRNLRGRWVEENWLQRFETAYLEEVRAWVGALLAGAPTGPSAWDGYMSLLVADACIAAAQSGQAVNVDIPPMAAIYRRP
jgi:myo-inositol 2-dehydrogenase/D-chiro-inositol 1-dehydrogenase